jgi:NAD-dependent deacetylase
LEELLTSQAKERFYSARNVVILTGAGISAESGIPTFRGNDGIWTKFSPEELASFDAFYKNTKIVAEWYKKRRVIVEKTQHNDGHRALAEMEQLFDSFHIITQNIDGLHQKAGSKNVIEIHGNIMHNYCIDCKKEYSVEEFDAIYEHNSEHIPRCSCGGLIRPDVVWFGEQLPKEALEKAFQVSEKADLFLSIGTSAQVRPASDLPIVALQNGSFLMEINAGKTGLTSYTHLNITGKSGKILPELLKEIKLNLHH